jgi:hypothetical protein
MNPKLKLEMLSNRILPKTLKFIIKNKKPIITAYKEDNKWYVKDFNGYSKNANELVDGVPELIQFLVGKEISKVKIEYRRNDFPEAIKLELVSTDDFGSYYQHIDKRGVPHMGWFCPVFFWYFKEPPENLYCRIQSIK